MKDKPFSAVQAASAPAATVIALAFVIFAVIFAVNSFNVYSTVTSVGGNLSCSFNQGLCQAGYTNILHISDGLDAHAELPAGNAYGINLCCKDMAGLNTLNHSDNFFMG